MNHIDTCMTYFIVISVILNKYFQSLNVIVVYFPFVSYHFRISSFVYYYCLTTNKLVFISNIIKVQQVYNILSLMKYSHHIHYHKCLQLFTQISLSKFSSDYRIDMKYFANIYIKLFTHCTTDNNMKQCYTFEIV